MNRAIIFILAVALAITSIPTSAQAGQKVAGIFDFLKRDKGVEVDEQVGAAASVFTPELSASSSTPSFNVEPKVVPSAVQDPTIAANEFLFTIQGGDTLWDSVSSDVALKMGNVATERRNSITAQIINDMYSMSASELQSMGVSSGNPDLIYPGERIYFAVSTI